jgi:hypothetical protein
MAKIMCDHWDVIENSYLDNSKFVFRKIRNEREQIIRYYFAIKNNFKDYLKRPDTKQLEIDAFVKVKRINYLKIVLCFKFYKIINKGLQYDS